MDLGEQVNKVWKESKKILGTSINRDQVSDYLREDKDLQKYSSNPSYASLFEQSVDRAFDKYKKDANSAVARFGAGAGVTASGVDVLSHFTLTDAIGTDFAHPIVLAKSVLEVPKVYRYLKSAHDLDAVKNMTIYGLRKAAGLLVPWVGPAIEGGALRDMLVNRVRYEAKHDFLKTVGKYEPMPDRVKRRVENVAGPWEDYAQAA